MARKYLRVREYPGCCGVWNIFSFGGAGAIYGWLRHQLIPKHELVLRLDKLKTEHRRRAFLTISLNGWQEKEYGATIRTCGFKLAGVGKNFPHDSEIYFYVCNLNPIEDNIKKKKSVRG